MHFTGLSLELPQSNLFDTLPHTLGYIGIAISRQHRCILSLARFTDVCSSAMVTTLAAGPSLAIVVVVEEVFEGLDLLDDLRDEATLRLVRHDHELTG